jgi:hypothetical protein
MTGALLLLAAFLLVLCLLVWLFRPSKPATGFKVEFGDEEDIDPPTKEK